MIDDKYINNESEEWSSQLIFQFFQFKLEN